MQRIVIGENEAGQRMDKFLRKFMPLAPASFFYKMLRKKNITLNGKKAEGKEKLAGGDVISFYLADETISGFRENRTDVKEYEEAYRCLKGIQVVYEDEHIVIMNKPAGILSQKAGQEDLSLNEWMIGYLLAHGHLDAGQLSTYRPSICNRLDRNTRGLVIGARSLAGSQEMNRLISSRKIRKYYRMLVKGPVEKEEILEGFLVKDEKNNTVHLVSCGSGEKGDYIKTRYYPIRRFADRTLVEAELITGKSHQIRIHMASVSHPLLGDYKYGDRKWNDKYKKQRGVSNQLLYACRLEFPEMEPPFEKLDKKIFEIPYPVEFQGLI
ncbi:MAG: RluA family pseudouridine synthase [Lachnospiraceae bacterium]|nr:RluA family pseudouridine synthase [Lachnospiraceae bacterium]